MSHTMPEHASIYEYFATRANLPVPVPDNPSSVTDGRPGETIAAIRTRESTQLQTPITFHHQQTQAQKQPKVLVRRIPVPYYGPLQNSGMVEIKDREAIEETVDSNRAEDSTPIRPSSPPSTATGSTTIALPDGSNNNTSITTHDSDSDPDSEPDDIPGAPLDPNLSTIIHPKGNLILIIGTSPHQRRLRVQAETIKHFGPRWATLVKNSDRKNLTSTRLASLPNDDPDMMLVLMFLSHPWHIGKVPKELSFRQLLALSHICARWDMNLQVSPYIRRWIAPHEEKLLRPGRAQWLWVAYQFGLERHYGVLARHLVVNCRADRERRLFVPGRWSKLGACVPAEALVEIRRKRTKALTTFLNTVYTLVDSLENGDTCRATLPDEDANQGTLAERAMCTHCNHGELIRYLKIHGYWPPIVQSSVVTLSVNEVYNHLTTIPAISYRHMPLTTTTTTPKPLLSTASSPSPPANTHHACDIGRQLAALIRDAKDKLEMPIAEATRVGMRENGRKAGLGEGCEGPLG